MVAVLQFQSDYLRKISLKMLTMESKSQNNLTNALPTNSAAMSRNPQDPGIHISWSYLSCGLCWKICVNHSTNVSNFL